MDSLNAIRYLMTRLRNIPGAIVLLEPIRRRLAKTDRTVLIEDFDGDLFYEVELRHHMGSHVFCYGSYSRHILRILDALVEPGMTVVDVGANSGEITVFAAKRVGPGGKVIAFEPLSSMADRLGRNVALNDFSQVTTVRMGLSDAERVVPIYGSETEFHDGTLNEGLATIHAGGDRTVELERIQLTTLDDYAAGADIGDVDVIKVDVEGAELDVLRGARRVLRDQRPWLILEVSDLVGPEKEGRAAGVLDFLAGFDYSFFRISRHKRLREIDTASLQCFQNVLACPPGKSPPAA
jgi:FkbM family methyltransferase